jgi:TonB family protein
MRVLVRGDNGALRSSISFSSSGLIHAAILGLVAFGKAAAPEAKPRSLYDEMIRSHEKEIVWYRLPDRLPEVSPPAAAARADRRPLRATRKSEQRIVAGVRDDNRPPQLVYSPLPEVAVPPPMPLPNVLAMEAKAPLRPFTPPSETKIVAPAPALPDAEAVSLHGAAAAGPALTPLRRTFTPPPTRTVTATATPSLPEAEAVALHGAAPSGPTLIPLRRSFNPTPLTTRNAGGMAAPTLPDAEAVGLAGPAPAGPSLTPLRKSFTAPSGSAPRSPAAPSPDLPAVSAGPATSDVAHLAIVGLDPAKSVVLPAPPASRTGGFSAGPKPEPNGAESDGGGSGVVVPGVTVRDGPSRQSLLAAIRPMAPPLPAAPPMPAAPPPARVSNAPDPSLNGRVVYAIAIQMPNITSYSGSWLVWFAEREGSESGGAVVRGPSPVRKVDPKYIASAVADGVQGVVRLGAVIRKDGHLDSIKLLRHLDDRLDHSAMESLAKWQFDPAVRDGAPVDVDAVFEIPFRLAPKPPR